MIKLIDILNEAKQVGTLYHFTNTYNLLDILKTNKLEGSRTDNGYVVSLTRDKDLLQINKSFNLRLNNTKGIDCRIKIDGNKLSNNYQLHPIRSPYFNSDDNKSKWSKTPKIIKKRKKNILVLMKKEELVILKNKPYIDNIKNYIIDITIYNQNYLPSYLEYLENYLKQ
jgi:hypothetical protein